MKTSDALQQLHVLWPHVNMFVMNTIHALMMLQATIATHGNFRCVTIVARLWPHVNSFVMNTTH